MEVSGGFQMELLPVELKLKIIECSTGADLAKLECVNSEWKALVRSSVHLWEKMCYKMLEAMPDYINRKDLPPEGLNWKELCILWTVILRNKFSFCWFFRYRNVYGLNSLFYKAFPCTSTPVKYYADFDFSSSNAINSDSDSEYSDSDSENSDYHAYGDQDNSE